MTETIRDENRDKLQGFIVTDKPELSNTSDKIKHIKENLSWSWKKLSEKIYINLQENSLPKDEEEKEICTFSERFKKAVERSAKSCKLSHDQDSTYSMETYWHAICQLEEVRPFVTAQEIIANHNEKEARRQEYAEYHKEIDEFNLKLIQKYGSHYAKELYNYILNNSDHILHNGLDEFISDVEEWKFPFLQTWLGNYFYYVNDDGIPKIRDAKEWYEKAHKQGDKIAQYQLGRIHEYEKEYQNSELAFKFYSKSAEQGFTPALIKVALCHYHGYGTPKDYEAFFHDVKKAADLNEPLGVVLCAIAFEKGLGINKNIKKSMEYYAKFHDKYGEIESILNYNITFKLAIFYKKNQEHEKAEKYFRLGMKLLAENMELLWNESMFDELLPIVDTSPEQISEILAFHHKDNVYKTSELQHFLYALFNTNH